ncbi:hypothetical protein Tco_0628136 [Tanacetum coccineum]|uniref:Retrotransposon gag domain-containing protein n=1 Tax=Tanacetum coccineum TaxID=301880 RepID=A0ABQ4WPH2_9ASTR
MVNVIPPDHVHDLPVVEPNQHDDAPLVPEPVLEDEDEDPEEDKFEEEEDPQEDEDDMEIDIKEVNNEPELTYPYKEVDPLNPPPPASESKPDNEIEVENPIEHEDETVPVSVYEVGESSTAAIPRVNGDRLLHGFMRRDIDSLFGEAKDRFYGKLILDLGNEVLSSVEQGTTTMEKLVEKLENVEEKAECKKLKKELKEARLSNTFLHMQNEQVERDLYWTRVRAHEIMPPKSAPMTQAAIRRMIKESFDATIAVFEISECAEGKKVKFVAATLEGPTLTWWKTNVATMGLETVNEMPWTEMKQLMTDEFYLIEEIQHMEHELWNLKIKEYDIVAYT